MNIKESLISALNSIRGNKLRASLTLLGIIIGVFSIIGVMTLLNALETGLIQDLASLVPILSRFRNSLHYNSEVPEQDENSKREKI